MLGLTVVWLVLLEVEDTAFRSAPCSCVKLYYRANMLREPFIALAQAVASAACQGSRESLGSVSAW